MGSTFTAGPFVFSASVLLLLVVLAVGTVLQRYLDRSGEKVERQAFRTFAVALIVSRLYFVWQYRTLYWENPWSIVDIRDGGWDAQAGLIAAWLYTLYAVGSQSLVRRKLVKVVGGCSLVWILGTGGMLFLPHESIPLGDGDIATLDGDVTQLSQFKGKVTVVNFWATWCPPCQREMPAMQRIQQARPDVNVVFLNQMESPDLVRQFLSAGRLALRNVLLDSNGSIARTYTVAAYPTTLFFDSEARLVYRHMGEMSAATIMQQLEIIERSSHY